MLIYSSNKSNNLVSKELHFSIISFLNFDISSEIFYFYTLIYDGKDSKSNCFNYRLIFSNYVKLTFNFFANSSIPIYISYLGHV